MQKVLIALLSVLLAGLVACGGGGGGLSGQPEPPVAAVSVNIVESSATVDCGDTFQFHASVNNATDTTITWTVNDVVGGNSTVGTMSVDGLYTSPADVPYPNSVTVKAAANVDRSKSDTATVTVIARFAISPAAPTVAPGQTLQFSANHPVATNGWWVNDILAGSDTVGRISSTGLYTAPASIPNPNTVTVKAIEQSNNGKSATATVTIASTANAKFSGPFAFWYMGYDPAAKPLYAVGSFVADGNGHLTDGMLDMNGVSQDVLSPKTAFTGTYQMNASDNRGQMVVDLPDGSHATFRFVIQAGGDKGRLIRYDTDGNYGMGVLKRQDPGDFLLSDFAGDYVLAITGSSFDGERNAAVGRMHTDGTGAISETEVDATNTNGTPTHTTFTGSIAMNSTTGVANGRGTLAVAAGPVTLNFTYYMVDHDEMFLVSTNQVVMDQPLYMGSMRTQTGGPFSAASFNGKSVFYMAGVTATGGYPYPVVMVGQFDVADGAGATDFAKNAGGSITVGGSFAVSSSVAANGRGLLTSTASFPYVFYLTAPNTGFLMQYDDPGTNVLLGPFEPQSAGPFDISVFNGVWYDSNVAAPTYDVPYGIGVQTWSGGSLTAIGDYSNYNGSSIDLPSSGSATIIDSAKGSGTLTSSSGSSTYHETFYIISPDKYVYIPSDASFWPPPVELVER